MVEPQQSAAQQLGSAQHEGSQQLSQQPACLILPNKRLSRPHEGLQQVPQAGAQQAGSQQLSAAQHEGSQHPLPAPQHESAAQQLGSAQHEGSQQPLPQPMPLTRPIRRSSRQGREQQADPHASAQQSFAAQHEGSQHPSPAQQLGSQHEPQPPSLSSKPKPKHWLARAKLITSAPNTFRFIEQYLLLVLEPPNCGLLSIVWCKLGTVAKDPRYYEVCGFPDGRSPGERCKWARGTPSRRFL
jgi:hypothetical protein